MRISVQTNAKDLAKWFSKTVPDIYSQEKNRALDRLAKGFAWKMVREVFNVKKMHKVSRKTTASGPKAATKNEPTAKVQIAKKMRVAGFKAVITGRNQVRKKTLLFSTRNPILIARETGGVAEPEISGKGRRANQSTDDGFLYARWTTKGRKRKWKKPYGPRKKLTGRAEERNRKLLAEGFEPRKIQQVRIRAVLGLRRRWRAFYNTEGKRYFDRMISETIRRANRAQISRVTRRVRAAS